VEHRRARHRLPRRHLQPKLIGCGFTNQLVHHIPIVPLNCRHQDAELEAAARRDQALSHHESLMLKILKAPNTNTNTLPPPAHPTDIMGIAAGGPLIVHVPTAKFRPKWFSPGSVSDHVLENYCNLANPAVQLTRCHTYHAAVRTVGSDESHGERWRGVGLCGCVGVGVWVCGWLGGWVSVCGCVGVSVRVCGCGCVGVWVCGCEEV
jgi:hypothetical protein